MVLALAVMGAAALADRGDGERERVARYIESVNRIQGGLGSELARVNRTYARFRTAESALATQAAELRGAERSLKLLEQQLGALAVPEAAERLQSQLLRLVSMQIDFAHELTMLGAYLPRLATVQRELAPAGERVRRDLAAARTPADQARAFGRYSAALERVADGLAELSAPPVLEPARMAELRRLRNLSTISASLRTAIEEQRAAEIERLAVRIARATSASSATLAERDAIVAFNARVRAIRTQRGLVERLGRELDRTVD